MFGDNSSKMCKHKKMEEAEIVVAFSRMQKIPSQKKDTHLQQHV